MSASVVFKHGLTVEFLLTVPFCDRVSSHYSASQYSIRRSLTSAVGTLS